MKSIFPACAVLVFFIGYTCLLTAEVRHGWRSEKGSVCRCTGCSVLNVNIQSESFIEQHLSFRLYGGSQPAEKDKSSVYSTGVAYFLAVADFTFHQDSVFQIFQGSLTNQTFFFHDSCIIGEMLKYKKQLAYTLSVLLRPYGNICIFKEKKYTLLAHGSCIWAVCTPCFQSIGYIL